MQESQEIIKIINSILWYKKASQEEIEKIITYFFEENEMPSLNENQMALVDTFISNFKNKLEETNIEKEPWGPKGKESVQRIVIGINNQGIEVRRQSSYKSKSRSAHAYTTSLVGNVFGKKTSDTEVNPFNTALELTNQNIVIIQTEGLNAQL